MKTILILVIFFVSMNFIFADDSNKLIIISQKCLKGEDEKLIDDMNKELNSSIDDSQKFNVQLLKIYYLLKLNKFEEAKEIVKGRVFGEAVEKHSNHLKYLKKIRSEDKNTISKDEIELLIAGMFQYSPEIDLTGIEVDINKTTLIYKSDKNYEKKEINKTNNSVFLVPGKYKILANKNGEEIFVKEIEAKPWQELKEKLDLNLPFLNFLIKDNLIEVNAESKTFKIKWDTNIVFKSCSVTLAHLEGSTENMIINDKSPLKNEMEVDLIKTHLVKEIPNLGELEIRLDGIYELPSEGKPITFQKRAKFRIKYTK